MGKFGKNGDELAELELHDEIRITDDVGDAIFTISLDTSRARSTLVIRTQGSPDPRLCNESLEVLPRSDNCIEVRHRSRDWHKGGG